MATQTIEIRSEYPGEANTVCRARNPSTGVLVQSSATLAAPDASGVRYFPQFTDLPAGEYLFVLESSGGDELTYGWATVTLTTATFVLRGVPAAELPPTATEIGDAFLAHILTKGDPGTIERAFWQMLKTQASVDGSVVDNIANTASRFNTGITGADGQYDHQVIVFVSGDLAGEARPIDTFTASGGVIVLQEALTAEPAEDDEFLILPSHVHPVSEIQSGLALETTSQSILEDTGTALPTRIGVPAGASVAADIAAVKSDTATLLSRVTTTVATLWANLTAMITGSGASAKYTVTALENAPSGEGGGGSTTISDEDIQEIVAGVTAVAPRICDSSAGTFRMRAGDTWIQDFTVTTTGADKFIVAVKNNAADEDSAAVLLIDSTDGLERINGAVPDDAGDASIATGAAKITVTVESNITLMIVPGKYVVTVKKLDVGSDATPISTASLTVFAPGVSEIST